MENARNRKKRNIAVVLGKYLAVLFLLIKSISYFRDKKQKSARNAKNRTQNVRGGMGEAPAPLGGGGYYIILVLQ